MQRVLLGAKESPWCRSGGKLVQVICALCSLPRGLIATDHYLGPLIDDRRGEIANIIDIN